MPSITQIISLSIISNTNNFSDVYSEFIFGSYKGFNQSYKQDLKNLNLSYSSNLLKNVNFKYNMNLVFQHL